MDNETMERLLIDRRLGELPPDTRCLLDAYLQVSPADAAAIAEINAVIDLAAQALLPKTTLTADELPPLGLSAPQVEESPGRPLSLKPQAFWPRPLALAASILLAFFLGTRWVQPPDAPMERDVQITDALSPASLNPQASSLDNTDFWSVARYAPTRGDRAPSQPAASHVEWTSPLVWPLVGESL